METILQNNISFWQLFDRPSRNWNNLQFNLRCAYVAICFKNKQQQVGHPANLFSFLRHIYQQVQIRREHQNWRGERKERTQIKKLKTDESQSGADSSENAEDDMDSSATADTDSTTVD